MPKRARNIDRNRNNFVPYVDTLRDTNFQKNIDSKKAAFVMFYDPRVPKCKEVRKPFVDVALLAASRNRGFFAVDCVKDRALCDCQCVSKYPSFKLYVNGHYLNDYDSAVSVPIMKKFVENAPIPGQCPHSHEHQQQRSPDDVFCSHCFQEAQQQQQQQQQQQHPQQPHQQQQQQQQQTEQEPCNQ